MTPVSQGGAPVHVTNERCHSTNARFAEAINKFLAELEKVDDSRNTFLRELQAKDWDTDEIVLSPAVKEAESFKCWYGTQSRRILI